jgi:hypothetical protein
MAKIVGQDEKLETDGGVAELAARQPIVTTHGRILGQMPTVLPLSEIGRSHLENPVQMGTVT